MALMPIGILLDGLAHFKAGAIGIGAKKDRYQYYTTFYQRAASKNSPLCLAYRPLEMVSNCEYPCWRLHL